LRVQLSRFGATQSTVRPIDCFGPDDKGARRSSFVGKTLREIGAQLDDDAVRHLISDYRGTVARRLGACHRSSSEQCENQRCRTTPHGSP
jgi:hypothetical protein